MSILIEKNPEVAGYSVTLSDKTGRAVIANLPEIFLRNARPGTGIQELKFAFQAAFDGVSAAAILNDDIEASRRAGDAYCTVGLWGPRAAERSFEIVA